jgi:hypothetical protein
MADDRELVVTGFGTAAGIPDRCEFTLALNVMAETAADALERVGALAREIIGVIQGQGVDRSDVQTLNVSLHDWIDRDSKKVTARVATYLLSVTARDLETSGPLLAAAAAAGGDSLSIQNLRMSVADPKPLASQARQGAVEEALAKARELADAAGLRLGPITSIVDGAAPPDRYWVTARRAVPMSSAAGAVPVEAGTSSVSAQVTITLRIED